MEASLLFQIFGVFELDDFDLGQEGITSLLMSGRKDPIASRNGYWVLFEKPKEKMFQGAV